MPFARTGRLSARLTSILRPPIAVPFSRSMATCADRGSSNWTNPKLRRRTGGSARRPCFEKILSISATVVFSVAKLPMKTLQYGGNCWHISQDDASKLSIATRASCSTGSTPLDTNVVFCFQCRRHSPSYHDTEAGGMDRDRIKLPWGRTDAGKRLTVARKSMHWKPGRLRGVRTAHGTGSTQQASNVESIEGRGWVEAHS